MPNMNQPYAIAQVSCFGAFVQIEIYSESQTFRQTICGWATSFKFQPHIANEAIMVFDLGIYDYDEYSTHWQQNHWG